MPHARHYAAEAYAGIRYERRHFAVACFFLRRRLLFTESLRHFRRRLRHGFDDFTPSFRAMALDAAAFRLYGYAASLMIGLLLRAAKSATRLLRYYTHRYCYGASKMRGGVMRL